MPRIHQKQTAIAEVSPEGIKVPVYNGSNENGQGKLLEQPEIMRGTILEAMFAPDELESLVLVKLEKKSPAPNHLDPIKFKDGNERHLIFSSGNSYYFGNAELKAKIDPLFETESDTACRYGSLLTTNCMEGRGWARDLIVKVVDFSNPDDHEAKKYQTGDCHGQISPFLADAIGGKSDRQLQFRLSWLNEWAEGTNQNLPSFLAKGTVVPNPRLETEGIDLVIDRSSIKGINKTLLNGDLKNEVNPLIPCGDYVLDKAILGNRGNSVVAKYDMSWQFSVWYSEEALRQDIVPTTQRAAQELAARQTDLVQLKQYVIEDDRKQQEKKANQKALNNEDYQSEPGSESKPETELVEERKLIKILKADKFNQLLTHPWVADKLQTYVQNRWRDLATKGAVELQASMGRPCDNLERGTVCIPHLPPGEVILTRYPIVSSDNIRRYENINRPDLMTYKGVISMHSKDAAEYHQGDFDGDCFVYIPSHKVPNIAAETLKAGEPACYQEVTKFPKVSYLETIDSQGETRYKTLEDIAIASGQNKIGIVATTIGQIASAVPHEGENWAQFKQERTELLDRLFISLQVEVDSPKSALRTDDIEEIDGANLFKDAKEWCSSHPSHFFDVKKAKNLYKHFELPTSGENPINVIAREGVNQYWQENKISAISRNNFRHLFPAELVQPEAEAYAKDLIEREKTARNEIRTKMGQDSKNDKEFVEELSKLYENLKTEISEFSPKDRHELAIAVGHLTHTAPNDHRALTRESAQLAKTSLLTVEDYTCSRRALPETVFVLQVPFKLKPEGMEFILPDRPEIKSQLDQLQLPYQRVTEAKQDYLLVPQSEQAQLDKLGLNYETRDRKIELAQFYKDLFDNQRVKYEAVACKNLPVVEFSFNELPDDLYEKLDRKFGQNYNNPSEFKLAKDTFYSPPAGCDWIQPATEFGKGALVFNLFPDEVCQLLTEFEIETATVIGIRHHDYCDTNFHSPAWQDPVSIEVKEVDGKSMVWINDKKLGVFSRESAKLPPNTTAEAYIVPNHKSIRLEIQPETVRAIGTELTVDPVQQEIKTWLKQVTEAYDLENRPGFKLDDWKVRLTGDGDFKLSNAEGIIVCEGNYKTNDIPLRAADARELKAALDQRTAEHSSPTLVKAGIER